MSRDPSSLEDLCVMAYLRYLENEIVTYVSLTQSKSHLVKGVAKRMIQVRGEPSSFIFHCVEVSYNPINDQGHIIRRATRDIRNY